MEIVQAGLGDLEAVAKLFDAYRVWYRMPSDIEGGKSFLAGRILQKESIIYLAKAENGEAVGFTQCYPLFSSTRMKRLWLLNDLFVHPEFRGQGISKLLIGRVQELAQQTNAAGVLLETEKSNDIGNKLYPQTGFHLEENNFYFWTTP